MKSLLFPVLSALLFLPLSTHASYLYPPGSSPGNPLYVEIEEPYSSPLLDGIDQSLKNSPYFKQQRQDAIFGKSWTLTQPQPIQRLGCPFGYVAIGSACMPYSSANTRTAPTQTLTLDQRCKYSFGIHAIAYGATQCVCEVGYGWTADRKYCASMPNETAIVVQDSDSGSNGQVSCDVTIMGQTINLGTMSAEQCENNRQNAGSTNRNVGSANYKRTVVDSQNSELLLPSAEYFEKLPASKDLPPCAETGNKAPCRPDSFTWPPKPIPENPIDIVGTAPKPLPRLGFWKSVWIGLVAGVMNLSVES